MTAKTHNDTITGRKPIRQKKNRMEVKLQAKKLCVTREDPAISQLIEAKSRQVWQFSTATSHEDK